MELETTIVGADTRDFQAREYDVGIEDSSATASPAYSKAMVPMRGKGKELCDLLRKELCIPEGTRCFEVRFAFDELVIVKCEFMPQEKG